MTAESERLSAALEVETLSTFFCSRGVRVLVPFVCALRARMECLIVDFAHLNYATIWLHFEHSATPATRRALTTSLPKMGRMNINY